MAIVTIQAPALSDIQKKRVGERILDSLHSEGVPASSIVVLFRHDDTDIFLDGGLLFEARPRHGAPAASPSAVTTVPKRPSAPAVPSVSAVSAAPAVSAAHTAPAKASAPAAPAPAPHLAPTPTLAPVPAPPPTKARGRGRGRAALPGMGHGTAPQQTPGRPLPNYSEAKEKVRAMLLNHGGLSSFQAQNGLDLKGHEGASALLRRIFADLEIEGMVEKQGQKRGTRYVLKGIAAAPPQQSAPVILVKHDKNDKHDRQEEAQGAPGGTAHIGF